MAIGMGNLLDAFVENGLTNHVKGGILHMSRPPQAVEVESEADLEALGELPAGSIAYTSEYAHMWQLTGSGTWATTEEKGGSGGGALIIEEGVTTWQEVHDAMAAGVPVVYSWEDTSEGAPEGNIMTEFVGYAFPSNGRYVVIAYRAAPTDDPIFVAESADGALSLYGG